MALQQPPGLLAVHTNMPATLPEAIRKALPAGPPPPISLRMRNTRGTSSPTSM